VDLIRIIEPSAAADQQPHRVQLTDDEGRYSLK
jgi:hypothetical protein